MTYSLVTLGTRISAYEFGGAGVTIIQTIAAASMLPCAIPLGHSRLPMGLSSLGLPLPLPPRVNAPTQRVFRN